MIHHRFESYRALEADLPGRANGVLVSMVVGKAVGFALDGLQERAEMFVAPGDEVYEGMVVGENSRRRQRPQYFAQASAHSLSRGGTGIYF